MNREMDKQFKFALPSPNFNNNAKDVFKRKPHYLTPSGMSLLPREKQPPPMYGKHGATVPSRYLRQHIKDQPQSTAPSPPEKQYCEPCELELHSLEDLKRHRAQHEKCPVDGCLYKGHPSVMDKHINALHSSGLFDKFKKLSTPEEIAAWREERRKRYPTLANVLLKQKAQEQRQKRGERLEANKNRFGKQNDRKRVYPNAQDNTRLLVEKNPREENKINSRNNKRNRKNKRSNQKSKQQEQKPKVQNEVKQINDKIQEGEETETTCGGIKMFKGTSQLKDYKHFSDKKKVVTNNALFGLVGMYGSDDDDSEELGDNSDNELETEKITEDSRTLSDNCQESNEIENIDNKNVNEDIDINKEVLLNQECNIQLNINNEESILNELSKNDELNEKYEDNLSDEAPEELAIQRSIPDYPINPQKNLDNIFNEEMQTKHHQKTEQSGISKQRKLLKRKSGLDYRKARLRKQNTMLEKLLENDIRHERNVLLQCVRYVCENNFFGIIQSNKENT
ncbi:nuclear FMR1 interacting protein 1 [Cochliomyia hominivorax]